MVVPIDIVKYHSCFRYQNVDKELEFDGIVPVIILSKDESRKPCDTSETRMLRTLATVVTIDFFFLVCECLPWFVATKGTRRFG